LNYRVNVGKGTGPVCITSLIYRPDVGLVTGKSSRTRRLIGIFAECAGKPGAGSCQSTPNIFIVSCAAFSSTCYLAGYIPSHSIDAYNGFLGARRLLETSGEKALDMTSPHFGQYTHISLRLWLRLRLGIGIGGGANDIRFDVIRTDVGIFGFGLTLMERIWQVIGTCLCAFVGRIKRYDINSVVSTMKRI